MEKVKLNAFILVGLKLDHKTTNEGGQSNIDCGKLWQKFEKENFVQRIPNKLSDEIYSVYFEFEGDHTKPFSYFIGCKVETGTNVPEDMTSLIVAEGQYTKLTAKGKMPDCVANTWKQIWNSNIARRYQHDFEVYGELSKDWNNSEVEIFVSSR
jgi:predicted transcriptional regulator YdeE